jgi:Fe2+ transport system protein FeoA
MKYSPDIRLDGIPGGRTVVITEFYCTQRQLSRLAPLGLIRGAALAVIRNKNGQALIIAAGWTTIALSRQVAAAIRVGGPHA